MINKDMLFRHFMQEPLRSVCFAISYMRQLLIPYSVLLAVLVVDSKGYQNGFSIYLTVTDYLPESWNNLSPKVD